LSKKIWFDIQYSRDSNLLVPDRCQQILSLEGIASVATYRCYRCFQR